MSSPISMRLGKMHADDPREADSSYRGVKHQSFVGTGYFDAVAQAIAGGTSSTTALAGSTEEEQFDHSVATQTAGAITQV